MSTSDIGVMAYRKQLVFVLICFTVVGLFYFQAVINQILSKSFAIYQKTFTATDNLDGIHYLIIPKNISCNPQPTVLIMIKCSIDEFEERRTIRNTWGKEALNLGMKIIFSIGVSNDSMIDEQVIDEIMKFGDILQTNFVESYHHLVLKSYSNLRWISIYCTNIKNVFITDSDVIVFPKALLQLTKDVEAVNNTIVGFCWMTGADPVRSNNSKSYMPINLWPPKEVWAHDKYPPYCSGTGYFMTGDVPDKLLNVIPNGSDNWQWAKKLDHLEDVIFTGLLTKLANVTLKHSNHFVYNKDIGFDLCESKTISLHSFRPPGYFLDSYSNYMEKIKNCSIHASKIKRTSS